MIANQVIVAIAKIEITQLLEMKGLHAFEWTLRRIQIIENQVIAAIAKIELTQLLEMEGFHAFEWIKVTSEDSSNWKSGNCRNRED